MRHLWKKIIGGSMVWFVCVLMVLPVQGATSTGPNVLEQLNAGSGAAGFGTEAKDPRIIVAEGVQIVLSLLGTIFLLLVFYAGFIMFTAAGNEEKIGNAKTIIQYAIIGLIIILCAYSITSFVLRRLVAEVGGL